MRNILSMKQTASIPPPPYSALTVGANNPSSPIFLLIKSSSRTHLKRSLLNVSEASCSNAWGSTSFFTKSCTYSGTQSNRVNHFTKHEVFLGWIEQGRFKRLSFRECICTLIFRRKRTLALWNKGWLRNTTSGAKHTLWNEYGNPHEKIRLPTFLQREWIIRDDLLWGFCPFQKNSMSEGSGMEWTWRESFQSNNLPSPWWSWDKWKRENDYSKNRKNIIDVRKKKRPTKNRHIFIHL